MKKVALLVLVLFVGGCGEQSKTSLGDNNLQLAKFIKKNMYGKKIVIGMGAGSISNWMRNLPDLM